METIVPKETLKITVIKRIIDVNIIIMLCVLLFLGSVFLFKDKYVVDGLYISIAPQTQLTIPVSSDERLPDDINGNTMIDQGDRIMFRKPHPEEDGEYLTTSCTAGYVDKDTETILIARHCISDEFALGGEFMFLDIVVGKTSQLPQNDRVEAANDWAVLKASLPDFIGENTFSGDTMASWDDVKIGDKVHLFGATTGHSVGDVYYKDNEQIAVTGTSTARGDSGGPVWIEGKGFIGITSTIIQHTRKSNNTWQVKPQSTIITRPYVSTQGHVIDEDFDYWKYANTKYLKELFKMN